MGIAKKSVLIIVLMLILCVIYFYNLVPIAVGWGNSSNYENYSVRTTVNITDAYPEILNVSCNNGTSITLNPGTDITVLCYVEIQDFNGGGSIESVNGTFYYYLNRSSDPDDNNEHYVNTSCTQNDTSGPYNATWVCAFDVFYYANNGTWIANITVNDSSGLNMTDSDTDNSTIDPLYALNVTPLIDFGNMAVGDTYIAAPPSANVTNFGNMNINISVYGFGGDNETGGSGFAMICEQRNITLPNERYDLSSATAYPAMTRISGVANMTGLTIPQQTNDSQQQINATYWRLHVNVSTNPFGECNGTVVFAAEAT